MKKLNYFIIGLLLCFYGINNYLDVGICIALAFYLLFHIKNDEFEFLYFGLLFFEPILNLPFVGGSFYKIYQVLFIIKILIDLKEKKLKITKLFFIPSLFLITTGLLYNSINSELSLFINVFMICYILSKEKNDNYYQNLLSCMGILITFTAIYGFFRGRVLDYSYLSFVRVSTTIRDPNYSALFLNIGIFSILGNSSINKMQKIILLAILIISLFMTVSLSGIGICAISFIAYCYLINFKKGMKYTIIVFIALIVLINIPLKQNNILYGFQARLLNIEEVNVDKISSGRETISKYYIAEFKTLPLKNKLFGGKNTISGEYRESMVNKYTAVSHNSYIDMLYMIGIVGTTILLLIYLLGMKNLIQTFKSGITISLNILLIKIVVLFSAFIISIFPFRYFIAIYILNIINEKRRLIKFVYDKKDYYDYNK